MEFAIGPASQIPLGEGRTFDVAGTRVAVFRMRGGDVFATQAYCPHRGGPLADGLTDGRTVTCPLHDRIYNLRTGAGVGGTDCDVTAYPVKLAADGTMVLSMAEPRVQENVG